MCEISGSTTHIISIDLLVAPLILWRQLEVIRPSKGSGSETTLTPSLPVRSSCLSAISTSSTWNQKVVFPDAKFATVQLSHMHIYTQIYLLLSMSSNWLSYDRYNRH